MLKKRLFLTLMSSLLIIALTIGISYAWYITTTSEEFDSPDVTGYSTAAYFAGGNGSKEKPYLLTNQRHFYNLAWLQYLGEFNKSESTGSTKIKQYYFKLVNDINCNNMVLPPIGTTENPFVGNFDGNGKVIKNYKISNKINENNITKKPKKVEADSNEFLPNASIVGTFGVIGKYTGMNNENLTITKSVNSVHDLYLDECDIKTYGNTLVGIVAGYVNGNVSNIGVHYADLSLGNDVSKLSTHSNISSYSIIGDYNDNPDTGIEWNDRPGAEGIGFGSSFDVSKLKDRLVKIHTNNITDGMKSPNLPTVVTDEENTYYGLADQNIIPLTVDPNSDYTKSDSYEIISKENIGYFLGSQQKVYETTIDFSTLHYGTNSSNDTSVSLKDRMTFWSKVSSGVYKEETNVDKEIQDVIFGVNKSKESNTLHSIALNYKIEDGDHNKMYKDNIYIGGVEYDNVKLPMNGIWFKPFTPGTIKFVVYSAPTTDGGQCQFILYKWQRTNMSNGFSAAVFGDNVDYKELPQNRLWYYEFEVTESDITNGTEYALGQHENGNPVQFLYLDIGTNANINPEEIVKMVDIDFVSKIGSVYDDMSLTTYKESDVAYSLDQGTNYSNLTNDTIVFYFRRNKLVIETEKEDEEGNKILENIEIVLYFIEPSQDNTNPYISMTKVGKGNENIALDNTCTTFANFDYADALASIKTNYEALNAVATSANGITYTTDNQTLINNLLNSITLFECLPNDEQTKSTYTLEQLEQLASSSQIAYYEDGAKAVEELITAIGDGTLITENNYKDYTETITAVTNKINSLIENNEEILLDYVDNINDYYEAYDNYIEASTYVVNIIYRDNIIPSKEIRVDLETEYTLETIDSTKYISASDDGTIWYTDSEFTTPYSGLTVSGDITLYANILEVYNIEIDYGNGTTDSTLTDASGKIRTDDTISSSLTNGDTTFINWTDSSGNIIGTTIDSINDYVFTRNETIKANWDYSNIKVTYDGIEYEIDSSTGKLITWPETPTLESGIFANWTDSNGNIVDENTIFNTSTELGIKTFETTTLKLVYRYTADPNGWNYTTVQQNDVELPTGQLAKDYLPQVPETITYNNETYVLTTWLLNSSSVDKWNDTTITDTTTIPNSDGAYIIVIYVKQ